MACWTFEKILKERKELIGKFVIGFQQFKFFESVIRIKIERVVAHWNGRRGNDANFSLSDRSFR